LGLLRLRIVDIQMRHLLAKRHTGLELTGAARRHLADAGYDPVYGAWPLKRVIQREMRTPRCQQRAIDRKKPET